MLMAIDSLAKPTPRAWRTRLCSWGTSQAVRIPKSICDEAGIVPGDELDLVALFENGETSIVIKGSGAHRSFAAAPRASLRELFANYQGDYQPEELDWGSDVGAEAIE
jgi:antitoxin MazE